jgi:septal ring-binding cell division protein DamX
MLFVLLFLVLLAQPIQADYQSGLDAYNAARYTTALDNWKAVAEQSPSEVNTAIYAETHYAIGMLYWLGQGVAPDWDEAAKWLRKAAELGNAGAQGKLGFMYTEGITVEKDHDQAFQWFSKAAKQGDVDGQYNLGIFYLNGWGTEQDKTLAAQYLAAASAQGDEGAEAALQGLLPMSGQSLTGPGPSIFFPTTWIKSQNPNHYTIQVIGLSKKTSLENLIKGHENLAPFATYTLQRNNKPLHLLIQGVYPNVEDARKAKANFPKSIQKPKDIWIRKFEKIQELIK